MAYRPVDLIEVRMWGQTVGAVTLDPTLGYYVFEYAPQWQSQGIEISPVNLPVARSTHVFPLLPEATFKRLPAVLADALPDDFGNALIDAYLAREGVTKAAITPLDRLAYMAGRGMGALEFRPARGPRRVKPTAIEISELVAGSRRALAGRFDGDRETEAALLHLIQVGTSAGGARAKAVIAWHPDTHEIRSGQLPADPGFEYWLLKLDGVGRDAELGTGGHYGRIEYAYHRMALAAGIEMSECRLLEENGRAHFMTRRFDRVGDEKLHAQTLCAMQHLDYKQRGTHDYNQYFQAIDALGLSAEAREEAFRRMTFNVLAANCDDHTKNLSFLMDRAGRWRLSPAYDITHAYNPHGEWTYQHLMSVNGAFRGITREDLRQVGDRFLVPAHRSIVTQVQDAVAEWPRHAASAGLPGDEIARVASDFPTL
ncbi:phosphatidylinositol kinase [Pandoraea terrae]|uniref:Phosphatidylinositol kinase n=1 Tax=Pandoraea terrae TaxID=1537710 RepID=A0A5E4SEU7_9BURK|nr:type II toxin-antitoxin system HipA family toxin [Pandoraea terrae]VVD72579.1 phosphatidylinositol kinase [Pandoraea terrae]